MAPPAVSDMPVPAAPSSECSKKHKAAAAVVEQQEQLAPATQNEFELQRLRRIEHNRQVMRELGVEQAAAAIKASMEESKQQRCVKRKKSDPSLAPAPSRRSNRLATQPLEQQQQQPNAAQANSDDTNPDHASLLTQEEYFELIGQKMPVAFESDGKFKGWVSPAVCAMYGIASSAAEAWESNGGGKWSRKPDMSAVPAHLRAKGWSEAKAFAATMLRKNPNTYFYRHVAPHEEQGQGEWSQEEHELFMATAREHGVGNKWGLFASYIPRRVGYQCSSYYRDVVVAQGLVVDRRFRMTRCGKAVYVGA